ncbi:11-beta-hydroxysteroid dehydrogenase 1B [Cinnamomum micranthum f. kanehirae]|uniref:11-beta-hydroxysteroid dehydrogenase 1B n=1 Tax=Cinnamomum micranthum f. kanehirae TaxID=337451 RepID=A0A443P8F9_9MAGN|nr:11-beta-hydroxysteroid dehydrogenase 1B [Cinnamomum micranthum f. kanehirae]
MTTTIKIRIWEVSLYTVCSADFLAWVINSAHWDQGSILPAGNARLFRISCELGEPPGLGSWPCPLKVLVKGNVPVRRSVELGQTLRSVKRRARSSTELGHITELGHDTGLGQDTDLGLSIVLAGWLPVPQMSFYNVIKHFIQSLPTVLAIFLMAFYSLDYFHQASKAALISFYETLRIEFGSDVERTIATPGVVGLNRGCPKGNFCPKKARCW